MKTALTYFTVDGEKRLTPLAEVLCLIGVFLALIGIAVFFGEGIAFGLLVGFFIGVFYQERANRKREYREYREKLNRELRVKSQDEL